LHPFRVKVKNIVITVLGTAFAVKTGDSEEVSVTVIDGRVNVGDGSRIFGTLGPGREMVVNTANMEYYERKVDSPAEKQWKGEFLVLRDMSFKKVLTYVKKQFQVEIEVANPALNHCRVTMSLDPNGDIGDLMGSLCHSLNATYVRKGNRFIIDGGGCE